MKTIKLKSTRAQALGLLLALTSGVGELAAQDQVLFQLDGLDYRKSELSDGLRLSLYDLEKTHHEGLLRVINEALFEIYLKEEATRLKKTPAAIRAMRLSVKEPEEPRIKAFYDRIKHRINRPYQTIRAQIVQLLQQQDRDTRKAQLLAAYRQEKGVEIALLPPRPPFVEIHTKDFPSKGHPQAPVTIVDFADYQCPHCKVAAEALARVHKRYKGQVRIVYMDYPINASSLSRRMAKGAFCAQQSGKFQAYHDLAYQRQASLNESSPIDIAKEIGLDVTAFTHCHSSEAAENRVAQSEREGQRLKLTSTPTLFVNGQQVTLTDMEQDLTHAVDKALARATSQ